MYSVVLADGRRFGPIDINGLVQWTREGRLGPESSIVDHASGRQFLARDLAELAAVFSAPPVQPTSTYPSVYGQQGYGGNAQPGYPQPYSQMQIGNVGYDGQPLKSKVAAGLLGILLGPIGAHRFYLGYTGLGVVMLLITVLTCGWGGIITSIWGIVEGIMCLTGSMSDSRGRPLTD